MLLVTSVVEMSTMMMFFLKYRQNIYFFFRLSKYRKGEECMSRVIHHGRQVGNLYTTTDGRLCLIERENSKKRKENRWSVAGYIYFFIG
jgi:hypothetical protein